jgi:hypothetical protein
VCFELTWLEYSPREPCGYKIGIPGETPGDLNMTSSIVVVGVLLGTLGFVLLSVNIGSVNSLFVGLGVKDKDSLVDLINSESVNVVNDIVIPEIDALDAGQAAINSSIAAFECHNDDACNGNALICRYGTCTAQGTCEYDIIAANGRPCVTGLDTSAGLGVCYIGTCYEDFEAQEVDHYALPAAFSDDDTRLHKLVPQVSGISYILQQREGDFVLAGTSSGVVHVWHRYRQTMHYQFGTPFADVGDQVQAMCWQFDHHEFDGHVVGNGEIVIVHGSPPVATRYNWTEDADTGLITTDGVGVDFFDFGTFTPALPDVVDCTGFIDPNTFESHYFFSIPGSALNAGTDAAGNLAGKIIGIKEDGSEFDDAPAAVDDRTFVLGATSATFDRLSEEEDSVPFRTIIANENELFIENVNTTAQIDLSTATPIVTLDPTAIISDVQVIRTDVAGWIMNALPTPTPDVDTLILWSVTGTATDTFMVHANILGTTFDTPCRGIYYCLVDLVGPSVSVSDCGTLVESIADGTASDNRPVSLATGRDSDFVFYTDVNASTLYRVRLTEVIFQQARTHSITDGALRIGGNGDGTTTYVDCGPKLDMPGLGTILSSNILDTFNITATWRWLADPDSTGVSDDRTVIATICNPAVEIDFDLMRLGHVSSSGTDNALIEGRVAVRLVSIAPTDELSTVPGESAPVGFESGTPITASMIFLSPQDAVTPASIRVDVNGVEGTWSNSSSALLDSQPSGSDSILLFGRHCNDIGGSFKGQFYGLLQRVDMLKGDVNVGSIDFSTMYEIPTEPGDGLGSLCGDDIVTPKNIYAVALRTSEDVGDSAMCRVCNAGFGHIQPFL